MLEYIVLGIARNEPISGYDIKKAIENGIGTFYKASFGSLYPILERLRKKGLLDMSKDSTGVRTKKLYMATELGKEKFLEWLVTPMSMDDADKCRLAKIYFFDLLEPEQVAEQLSNYQLNNENYLKKLEELRKKFEECETNKDYYYKLSTLYYGIAIVRENIRWCEHIRKRKKLDQFIIE